MTETLILQQREIIDKWYNANMERLHVEGFKIESDETFKDVYFQLLEINDFETIDKMIMTYVTHKISKYETVKDDIYARKESYVTCNICYRHFRGGEQTLYRHMITHHERKLGGYKNA